jgi:hypothetical protein
MYVFRGTDGLEEARALLAAEGGWLLHTDGACWLVSAPTQAASVVQTVTGATQRETAAIVSHTRGQEVTQATSVKLLGLLRESDALG